MRDQNACKFQIAGWVLFILSALLFVWSTARVGDAVGLAASLLFLVACLVFLVPIIRAVEEKSQ